MASAEGETSAGRYQLLIPQPGGEVLVPIAAGDDVAAINAAWTYVMPRPAILTATLQEGGRVVSHLSRSSG